jgi:uncharacterized membrane protein (UPF0127 family)
MFRRFVLALLLFAAAPAAAQQPQDLPRSNLIIVADGQRLAFKVQWARSPNEMSLGLMYRRSMPSNEGMLLDYGRPSNASIWMRNTFIGLDIIFIRADGTIESIQEGRPLDETTIPSRGRVRAVLELNAGVTRLLGIKPGDKVLHKAFGNTE